MSDLCKRARASVEASELHGAPKCEEGEQTWEPRFAEPGGDPAFVYFGYEEVCALRDPSDAGHVAHHDPAETAARNTLIRDLVAEVERQKGVIAGYAARALVMDSGLTLDARPPTKKPTGDDQ